MKIIVCIKKVTKVTNSNIKNEHIMNVLDKNAIELALKMKESLGGEIIAISMGDINAKSVLHTALAMGVDDAILLCDNKFAGSDTLATSYILSSTIKKVKNVDFIICGNHSSDGETGQIGPEIATMLEIPFITNCIEVLDIRQDYGEFRRIKDNTIETIKMQFPGLITVGRQINKPRYATLKQFVRSKKIPIKVWSGTDIAVDYDKCGLVGSPTKVISTTQLKHCKVCEFLGENALERLVEIFELN